MALNVEEPHAALAHVGLSANEDAAHIDTERLELVLQAMVKADDLGGCQSIVAEAQIAQDRAADAKFR